MNLTFYICNRKKPCHTSVSCGKKCKHTINEAYALYDEHEEFERDTAGIYWEKERNEQRR